MQEEGPPSAVWESVAALSCPWGNENPPSYLVSPTGRVCDRPQRQKARQ